MFMNPTAQNRKRLSVSREFAMSMRQSLRILFSDRKNLILALAFPIAAAIITVFIAGENMFVHYDGTKSASFVLVSAAIWGGLFNSIQIIVKERGIIKREYIAGRRLGCYILSKALVQLLLCLAESLLLLLAFPGVKLKFDNTLPESGILFGSSLLEFFVSIFLLMFAADTMGIFISSLVRKEETANVLAPYILILQLIFSGILFSMKGASEMISYAMLSRWGMEALGSISDVNALPLRLQLSNPELPLPHDPEDMFLHTPEHLRHVWLILAGFAVLFLILSRIALRSVAKDTR